MPQVLRREVKNAASQGKMLAIQAYLLKALQAFLAHLAINLVSGVRGNRNGRDALQVVLIAQAHRAATHLRKTTLSYPELRSIFSKNLERKN